MLSIWSRPHKLKSVASLTWSHLTLGMQTNKDHLVPPGESPPWFLALVLCECLIQLPAFFILAYGLAQQKVQPVN